MKGLFEKFGEVGRKMKEVGSLVLEAKDSLADNPFGALNSSLDALYGGSTEVRKFSFLTTKFIHEKKLLKFDILDSRKVKIHHVKFEEII